MDVTDLPRALIALDATAKIAGPEGERELAVEKLYHTPAGADERELSLKPNGFSRRS